MIQEEGEKLSGFDTTLSSQLSSAKNLKHSMDHEDAEDEGEEEESNCKGG